MTRPALQERAPIGIAHRGSRLLWPENTMTAFQGAVDLGYRFLETDLHATRDGVLVLHHDPTLDRTTSGTGKVSDYSLTELRQLDAAAHFQLDGDFPHRGRGVTVPTLEELLSTFPDTVVTVDLKTNGLEPFLGLLLSRHHWWDRVIVGSFSDLRLRRFRRETGGRVATSAGRVETARFLATARAGRVPSIPADALQVPVSARRVTVVDRKTVAAAHAAMKQVHVWTVNEPTEMHRLLDLGVDGIITDRPDLLNEVIAQRAAPE
jgi:glycerophosphoryl diester phosphodiesterase